MDGQPAPIGDVGSVAFDVTDRLAIINLFGAYAHTYDENRLDEFRTLFTDSPELVLLHEGRALSADIDTVMSLLAVRKAGFKAENNQRRHALNSYWFSGPNSRRGDRTLLSPGIRRQRRRPAHPGSDRPLRIHRGQAGRQVAVQPVGGGDRPDTIP
jgi:hypothetical protein